MPGNKTEPVSRNAPGTNPLTPPKFFLVDNIISPNPFNIYTCTALFKATLSLSSYTVRVCAVYAFSATESATKQEPRDQ